MIGGELADRFLRPGPEFGPTPLWWWSGAKVTREQLTWQLERFVEGGIRSVVVINLSPKGPAYGSRADDPAWFGEEWWELAAHVCDVAAGLGMTIWFYDQIGFSGANLQGAVTATLPTAVGRDIHHSAVAPGLTPRTALPEGAEPVAAYRRATDGWARIDLDSPSDEAGGVLAYTTPAPFDYLQPAAVAALIDHVHGEFERRLPQHLGTTIAGTFQDELPAMNTWTSAFDDEFARRCGYALTDVLPELWEPGVAGDRVRGDYQRVRAALAEAALFRPLAEWHRAHGMLLGSDQMSPAREGYPTQGVQIYGDYMGTHRWYSAAGSDHEGDARIHGSLADLYDHPRVWIESFHSSGWGTTLEDTWDWLMPFLRAGANLYNPHASYYGTAAGWFEWAPPSTDYRQPYFAAYRSFADAVSRACALLTWGTRVVDVAVLNPVSTAQASVPPGLAVDYFGSGDLGGDHIAADDAQALYREIVGSTNWFDTSPGALDRLGIDFTVADEPSVRRGSSAEGVLRVGELGWCAVILPGCVWLDADTATALIAALDAGVRVIVVGPRPAHASGRDGDDAIVAALMAHPSVTVVDDVAGLSAALAGIAPTVAGDLPLHARADREHGIAFLPAAFPNASAYPLRSGDEWRWADYDFDPARYRARTTVTIAGAIADAEVWDPIRGGRRPVSVSYDGERSVVSVDFAGRPAAFLVWSWADTASTASVVRPADALEPRSTDTVSSDSIPLDDGWTGELVATMDNRWGDFAYPAGSSPVPLEAWTWEWQDEDAAWIAAKAGFGQEVLITAPAAASAHPDPLTPDETAEVLAGRRALGDDRWSVHRYSASRGVDADSSGALGPKGLVPEEFVYHASTAPGEEVGVRALIRVPEPGEYDLHVAAPADRRVWLNGVEVVPADAHPGSYETTTRVRLTDGVAVLEYRLGASEKPHSHMPSQGGPRLGSSFSLSRPGTSVSRPEFMAAPAEAVTDGVAQYRRTIELPSDAVECTVILGAGGMARLEIGGIAVARQEKAEYYVSPSGATPKYFTHVLPPLSAGTHDLRLFVETPTPHDAAWLDLAALHADGSRTLVVSGPEWTVGDDASVVLVRGRTSGAAYAHVVTRPHPLPDAHWLSGAPAVGEPRFRLETAVRIGRGLQRYRTTVPAGTRSVELPIDAAEVRLDGRLVSTGGGRVELAPSPATVAELEVSLAPRDFASGMAAWTAPAVIDVGPAPIPIGDWSTLGLGGWSGGVTYSRELDLRELEVNEHDRVVLDLGRVRGVVRVTVDGDVVGEAFCEPYRFDLGARATDAPARLEVTVYNTLAGRLAQASPTTWIFPSQHESGILGPVRLHRSRDS